MNLSQELTTLEQVARLALEDLEATDTCHSLSRKFHDELKSMLTDYVESVSDKKLLALAFGR